jgi:acetyl-CoA carboxylase biotin carboxyl carrier protein
MTRVCRRVAAISGGPPCLVARPYSGGMSTEVASDLVANVASVLVAVGDAVAEGDELALLESMKMEIPVLAEVAGTVTDVRVQPGDVVQEGDVLVVIG